MVEDKFLQSSEKCQKRTRSWSGEDSCSLHRQNLSVEIREDGRFGSLQAGHNPGSALKESHSCLHADHCRPRARRILPKVTNNPQSTQGRVVTSCLNLPSPNPRTFSMHAFWHVKLSLDDLLPLQKGLRTPRTPW